MEVKSETEDTRKEGKKRKTEKGNQFTTPTSPVKPSQASLIYGFLSHSSISKHLLAQHANMPRDSAFCIVPQRGCQRIGMRVSLSQ